MNITDGIKELIAFAIKELRACVFAGSFFAILVISHKIPLFGLPRYDFLFLTAILIQIILIITKIESFDEVKMIFLFHIIGFALEVFKTNPEIGSWSYPEFGYLKLMGVPLYSGFMYAAVGSYMSQAWKVLKLELINSPSYLLSIPLSILIYLNFFTHHFIPDLRWILGALVIIIFWKTKVRFTPLSKVRSMPLVLSFFLIAFFIWIAENIATYLGAWKYPDQLSAWHLVSIGKISSWTLLAIISFMIVANLKHFKKKLNE